MFHKNEVALSVIKPRSLNLASINGKYIDFLI